MAVIKYLLSKSYRNRINFQYSKDLCGKLVNEENQVEGIYRTMFGNGEGI